MALHTVTETLTLPAGRLPTGLRARLRLVAAVDGRAVGYATASGVSVIGEQTADVRPDGSYQFGNVNPNSGDSDDVIDVPDGTVYELVVTGPKEWGNYPARYLAVPDAGSSQTYTVDELLTEMPDDLTEWPGVAVEDLPAGVDPDGSELLVAGQDGATVTLTVDQLAEFLGGVLDHDNGATIGSTTSEASMLTTPLVIPAGTLQVGDVVEVHASMSYGCETTTTFATRLLVGSASPLDPALYAAPSFGSLLANAVSLRMTMVVLGVTPSPSLACSGILAISGANTFANLGAPSPVTFGGLITTVATDAAISIDLRGTKSVSGSTMLCVGAAVMRMARL